MEVKGCVRLVEFGALGRTLPPGSQAAGDCLAPPTKAAISFLLLSPLRRNPTGGIGCTKANPLPEEACRECRCVLSVVLILVRRRPAEVLCNVFA